MSMDRVYIVTEEQMEEMVGQLCKDNRNASSQNVARVINTLGRLPCVRLDGIKIVPDK